MALPVPGRHDPDGKTARAMAREQGRFGIDANAVRPGCIGTSTGTD